MLICLHCARLLTAYVSYTLCKFDHQNATKQTKFTLIIWSICFNTLFYTWTSRTCQTCKNTCSVTKSSNLQIFFSSSKSIAWHITHLYRHRSRSLHRFAQWCSISALVWCGHAQSALTVILWHPILLLLKSIHSTRPQLGAFGCTANLNLPSHHSYPQLMFTAAVNHHAHTRFTLALVVTTYIIHTCMAKLLSMAVIPPASPWHRRHDSTGYLRGAFSCTATLCRPLLSARTMQNIIQT